MATKHYEFTGKVKWAKLSEANKDTMFDPDGVYTLNLYPQDQKTWDIYADSGIRTHLRKDEVTPKEDEDGKFITFRRKHKQMFSGEIQELGPPALTYEGDFFIGIVPNGSTITVRVAAFDSRKGIGHRLNSVVINELAELEEGITFRNE
jgi:hypothetical protein